MTDADRELIQAVQTAYAVGGQAAVMYMAEHPTKTRYLVEAVTAALVEGWEIIDAGFLTTQQDPHLRGDPRLKSHLRRHTPSQRWYPTRMKAGIGALLLKGTRPETDQEVTRRVRESKLRDNAPALDWVRAYVDIWGTLDWVWSYPDVNPPAWGRLIGAMKLRLKQESTEAAARSAFRVVLTPFR